jgi:uracil-DNA glycosylase
MSSDVLIRQIRQFLEVEQAFGLETIPKHGAHAVGNTVSQNKKEALWLLEKEFSNCLNCGLGSTRTHIVFGSGNPDASLMFIGEAPGADEDREGLPFVGAAGQLLTKIIEAMKLKREDVYIANCLKCRPPQNRNPLPDEIQKCAPILQKQIQIIQPKIICTLGKFAAQTLLNTEDPISRLRGRFFDYNGIKLMPTFHPAYLLRNPGDKKLVWEDVQKIMKELGIS